MILCLLTVMTTVLNNYFPNRLTTDAGSKALTLNKPGPIVIGEQGFSYNAGSDEFGAIRFETSTRAYKVGDKLELIVPHCDPAVNEYDQIYATRRESYFEVDPIMGHYLSFPFNMVKRGWRAVYAPDARAVEPQVDEE